MPVFKVTHTRNIDLISEYIVESDEEFFTEDEAVDAVIDHIGEKELPKGVTVVFRQVDESEYDELFEAEDQEDSE